MFIYMFILLKKEDKQMTNSTNSATSKLTAKIPFTAIFFAVMTILCTIIRFLQYSAVIREDNGFFETEGGFLNKAYYIFFAIFVAGVLMLTFVAKKGKRSITGSKSGKELPPAVCIIGAVLFAVCGFFLALEGIAAFQNQAVAVLKVTVLLATFGFTFTGFIIFVHKRIAHVTALAFLLISSFYICAAAIEFMQRVYTTNLSSRLIVLSVNILLSVFFLSCGRLTARSETKSTPFTATICGYSVVLLIFSDAIARMLYYYSVDEMTQNRLLTTTGNGFELPNLLYVIQGIAVLWLIYALSAKREKNKEIEKETETENTDGVDGDGASAV